MSLSDDEGDFISADEDGFGEDTEPLPVAKKEEASFEQKRVVGAIGAKAQTTTPATSEVQTKAKVIEVKAADSDRRDESEPKTQQATVAVMDDADDVGDDGDDDDDEEALAERIRERNLKIARKFSAEIAKNIKISAPIPVKSPRSPVNDSEFPDMPTSETKSSLPPAPPPTPALSSSFNSEETLCSASVNSSQYGWRVPTKTTTTPKHAEAAGPSAKSEQARLALDRLSARLSQPDKNLFERVAEDIKKVSIKAEPQATDSPGGASIPIISQLGSPLSGWGWNNATKLFESASRVTSQVGSVVRDSVVSATHHLESSSNQQQQRETGSRQDVGDPQVDVAHRNLSSNEGKAMQNKRSDKCDTASMSANEASSNDALVDLTLNAMESLGKKAFGVMTERDESGSLQIKGLGRPWEHLLNLNKSSASQPPPVQQKDTPTDDHHDYDDNSSPIVTLESVDIRKKDLGEPVVTGLTKRKKHSNMREGELD